MTDATLKRAFIVFLVGLLLSMAAYARAETFLSYSTGCTWHGVRFEGTAGIYMEVGGNPPITSAPVTVHELGSVHASFTLLGIQGKPYLLMEIAGQWFAVQACPLNNE